MRACRKTRNAIANTLRVIEIYEEALLKISKTDSTQGSQASAALVEAEIFFKKVFGDQNAKVDSDT